MGIRDALREAGKHPAQRAWDGGLLAYVHRTGTVVSATKNADNLTNQIDAVLRIGWKLHSHSVTLDQREHTENLVFVFLRE